MPATTSKARRIGPGVYAVGPLGEIEMEQSVIDERRAHGLPAPATARHLTSPAPVRFLYAVTLRPVNYGHYPDSDKATGESLNPQIIAAYDPPRLLPNGRYNYGTVAYPKPLPFDRIWHFDLRPLDPVEAARYLFWLEANRDEDRAQHMLDIYLSQSFDWLVSQSDVQHNALAAAVLTIQAAETKPLL